MKILLFLPLFLSLALLGATQDLAIPSEIFTEKYTLEQWNKGDTAVHRWVDKMMASKEKNPIFEKLIEMARIPKEGHVLEAGEVRVCEVDLDNYIYKVCSGAKLNTYLPRILENRCCFRGCSAKDVTSQMCPDKAE